MEWKVVKGCKTYYVNEEGKVKRTLVSGKDKEVKPFRYKDGYMLLTTCENSKITRHTLAKVVAEAFIPNPDNLPHVQHRDKDLSNNCVSNLFWSDKMDGHGYN